MKKLLLTSLFLLAGFICLSAQNVVSGTVLDKDGNPVPGAKIEIVGSTESTLTELDGTFRMETQSQARKVKVYYVGMQTKVQTIKPEMVIKLANTNWWNREPQKYSWLVSVQGAFPESGVKNPSFGLMLGRVKEIGWYVKGVYSAGESTDGDYGTYYPEGSDTGIDYWTTGKDKRSFYSATAGVIVRLKSALHVYAGAGYANRQVAWQLADGSYAKHTDYSKSGVAADCGLMLKIGKFSINGGTIINLADGCDFIGNVGIGICF